MRNRIICLFAVMFLASAAIVKPISAQLPTEKFSYLEDFEANNFTAEEAHNNKCTNASIQITEDKAFSGKKSLKLEVTLGSGAYCSWLHTLVVPCAGDLRISARVYVAQPSKAQIGFVADFSYPPTRHSGRAQIKTFAGPTDTWHLDEADLVSWGAQTANDVMRKWVYGATNENVIVHLDKWGIFIRGNENEHVTVYIDYVRVEGNVPKQADYDAEAEKRFAPVRHKFSELINRWQDFVETKRQEITALQLSPKAEAFRNAALDSIRLISGWLDKFKTEGYATPREVARVQSQIAPLGYAPRNLVKISEALDQTKPFVAFVPRQTITNAKILPTSFLIPAPIADTLKVTACPREYESATFAIYAFQDIKGLKITAGKLRNRHHNPIDLAMNISVVKCWYQAGIEVGETNQKLLTPELLLKNDNLVKVDLNSRENYLWAKGANNQTGYMQISDENSQPLDGITVKDADKLQPVDLPANNVKQFWITINVPPKTEAGDYEGKLVLTAEGLRYALELKFNLLVLPFALDEPSLRYSIYYRGILTPDGNGEIFSDSDARSAEQYEAEMRNLKEHGVEYPTVYQRYDEQLLNKIFQIRRKAGLPMNSPLYTLGISTGNSTEADSLNRLMANVKRWIDLAKKNGYSEVFVYGIDEAYGELLASQRPAWCAVHRAGGKVFVACSKGVFETMGCLLDLAVFAGPPDKEEARKFHLVERQISCYGNPQVGNEEPETYRRNFGLLLWKAGYDGAMDYAYQHSFHHIWNDFDDPTYRDHVFAYPTSNGVINTIQWEGFREGVDDVRYVTTLLRAIEKAKLRNPLLAKQAKTWLNQIDVSGDLDELRAKVIEWILKLSR